jgi:hypothetical protein
VANRVIDISKCNHIKSKNRKKKVHKEGIILKNIAKLFLAIILSMAFYVSCFAKSAPDEDSFKFNDSAQFASIKIHTVSILPFKNEVGSQDDAEVSDLLNTLKMMFEQKGINVYDASEELEKMNVDISKTSLTLNDLKTIGKSMGADMVVSGTIYKNQVSKGKGIFKKGKGIATVGITGDFLLTSSGGYIYQGRLARQKKDSAFTTFVIGGALAGSSKKKRSAAFNDCAADLLNPLYEKLGIGAVQLKEESAQNDQAASTNKKSSDVEHTATVETVSPSELSTSPGVGNVESGKTTGDADKGGNKKTSCDAKFSILKIDGDKIMIDAGKKDGLENGMDLSVLRVVVNKNVEKEFPLAKLQIVEITESMVVAKVKELRPKAVIKQGDRIRQECN